MYVARLVVSSLLILLCYRPVNVKKTICYREVNVQKAVACKTLEVLQAYKERQSAQAGVSVFEQVYEVNVSKYCHCVHTRHSAGSMWIFISSYMGHVN